MSFEPNDVKAVIFIDSLGPGDLEHMDWTREHLTTGEMDASPVFVTPVVLGSIYTGTSPTEHGLPSISRYDQPSRLRPAGATLPEIAALDEQYDSVLQYGLPFIVPPQIDPVGDYFHASEAMGQSSFAPGNLQNVLTHFAPAGALDKPGENLDRAFNLRVDHCTSSFGTARNLMAMFEADVAFLSYRVADSYAHYHYDEPKDDDRTYRERLLEQIDLEIQYVADQAEGGILVFGDHGARELDEVFRLNRWLIERGYLEVDIDLEWREQAIEYGVIDVDEDIPGDVIGVGEPAVTINESESVAVSDDGFSGGITLLDGATEGAVDRLIDELGHESAIDRVAWTTELFGPGSLAEECPDLYAVRRPGAFVSGNLAPEPGGPELTRSGVHDPIGAFGTNLDLPIVDAAGKIGPTDLFTIIAEDFLDLEPDDVELGGDTPQVEADEEEIRQRLRDLGYL